MAKVAMARVAMARVDMVRVDMVRVAMARVAMGRVAMARATPAGAAMGGVAPAVTATTGAAGVTIGHPATDVAAGISRLAGFRLRRISPPSLPLRAWWLAVG